MKIPSIISNNPVLVGGVLLLAVAGLWIATRGAEQTGKDLGKGAVDLVFGTAEGVASTLYHKADSPATNPLYDFGSSIGETLFNWTHEEYKP